MSSWSKTMFALAAALVVVALGLAAERMLFKARAQHTIGQVVDVTASNGRCGGRRSRYSCTRFKAVVEYRIDGGAPRRLTLNAGKRRGHGMPVSASRHPPGRTVRLVYDPRNPRRIYRDSPGDVFRAPLLSLILGAAAGVGGVNQRGKRN